MADDDDHDGALQLVVWLILFAVAGGALWLLVGQLVVAVPV